MKSRIKEVNVEPVRSPGIHFSVRHVMRFLAMTFACLAFLSPAYAVTPPPDGGYPNGNTAEGTDALLSVTTGYFNTATGCEALYSNSSGFGNTATGYRALVSNRTGGGDTASGSGALYSNVTGNWNTATGADALNNNTAGSFNTASGLEALFFNTTGSHNTATGFALHQNTTGSFNTATGDSALLFNTIGNKNTATGAAALFSNTTGDHNTASGDGALKNNTTGSNNIAIGSRAGIDLTTGDDNIDIGAAGAADESSTMRIGGSGIQKSCFIAGIYGVASGTAAQVVINPNGKLGTIVSSSRFKEAIKPMESASESIFQLEPMIFRYKRELDPTGTQQFGLVAEQVAAVDPELVVRDEDGKVNTVRYEAVNAMLLNEFIKEHRRVQELEAKVAQQKTDFEAAMAKQTAEIANLVAGLKEQESEVRSVKDQLTLAKSRTQVVVNEP